MEPKKNPKANVGRNSSLYFAIGLALMLFLTNYAINYKTYDKSDIDIGQLNLDELDDEEIPITEQLLTPPPPPPKNLNLVDITTMLPNSKFKKSDIEDRINRNIAPLTLAVANKLPKPDSINQGEGVYYPFYRQLDTDMDELTPVHEYGHHIDHMIGQRNNRQNISYSIGGTEFMSALDLDAKNMGLGKGMRKKKAIDRYLDELYKKDERIHTYKNTGRQITYYFYTAKYDQAENLGDIIDGLARGNFKHENYGVAGHSKAYWKQEQHIYNEAFAEIFTVYKSRKAKKWLKDNMPNTLEAFENIMREVIDG